MDASAESGHEIAAASQFANNPQPLTGPVLSNMLLGEDEFTEPVHLLRDLTGEQATAKPAGVPESIAQILAHTQFWQHYNLEAIRGASPVHPADNDATWPESVPEEQWQPMVSDFLSDLDEMIGLTEDDDGLSRTVREDETVGDRIRYTAVHNAYHFGQITLLRRMQGFWPPEGGENTY